MRTTITVMQAVIRLAGAAQLALGALFWTGNALTFIPLHMLIGLVVVLLLWAFAALAVWARVGWGLAALAAVWGLVVPALGVAQGGLVPGSLHWLIQVLHLLVGIAALALAERLAVAIKRALPHSATPRIRPAAVN